MKIYEVKSENFKKLSAVEILLDGKGVTITGKNGVGKSTFIDAIYTTLTGNEIPKTPVQIGKEKAKNTVKIKDEEGNIIIVEKVFAGDKKTLTVKTPSGAKYSSPQNFLNETIGNISFDPFEFISKTPMEQKTFLMNLLKIDFKDIEKKKNDLLSEKNNNTKLASSVENELNMLNYYIDIKDLTEKNASGLLSKIQEANELNNKKLSLKSEVEKIEEENLKFNNRTKEIEKIIDELIKEQEGLFAKIEENNNKIDDIKRNIGTIDVPDISNIQNEMNSIDEYNKKVRENIYYKEKEKAKEKLITEGERIKSELEKLEAEKIKIIKTANMPVEGLEFSETGLLYNNLPLDENQLSKAKLIEIGLKISMALNPKLRIMRIKDGSLLDSEMLSIIRNACEENDYQLFLEKVTEDKEIGFIIEEGLNEKEIDKWKHSKWALLILIQM